MSHGPAIHYHEDEDIVAFKSRIGIILFCIYAIVYVVFVAINTASPETMEMKVLFGLNLAGFYGFGLIVLAIIMGLIYNRICSVKEKTQKPQEGGDEK